MCILFLNYKTALTLNSEACGKMAINANERTLNSMLMHRVETINSSNSQNNFFFLNIIINNNHYLLKYYHIAAANVLQKH